MFRTRSLSDELFLIYLRKFRISPFFSILYMIRIRFFGPGEINTENISARTVLENHSTRWPNIKHGGNGLRSLSWAGGCHSRCVEEGDTRWSRDSACLVQRHEPNRCQQEDTNQRPRARENSLIGVRTFALTADVTETHRQIPLDARD